MQHPSLPTPLSGPIDPNGGFLCMTVHWRPSFGAPDLEMPGEKLSMSLYLRHSPAAPCLCGSGKSYRACCRPQRYWWPVCPNPGPSSGYSRLAPQTTTFAQVNGALLRERLMADPRLHCVDQSPTTSFWLFWGDPPVQDQYGILCFGDVELKDNTTLIVTAMSDLRMQVLLDLLQEIASECLGSQQLHHAPVPLIDKKTGKLKAPLLERKL